VTTPAVRDDGSECADSPPEDCVTQSGIDSMLTASEKTNLLQTIKPLVPGTLYTIEPVGYEFSRWWVEVTPGFEFPQMRTKTDRRDGIYLATVSKTATCSPARGGNVVDLGMDQRSESIFTDDASILDAASRLRRLQEQREEGDAWRNRRRRLLESRANDDGAGPYNIDSYDYEARAHGDV
jgi:hypothetical protein